MVDIIDMESYDSGYNAGFSDAYGFGVDEAYTAGYTQCKRDLSRHLKKQKAIRERKLYFLKQKLTGVVLILLSIVLAIIVEYGLMPALFIGFIGSVLLFSKHMVLTNNYYFEHREEM